jgi:hypothetical protein
MWSALSDEKTGLSFTIIAAPRQRSYPRVRVPRDSWLVDWSVKLLLAFVSTVIPRFSFLEIHSQYFYSLLGIFVFRNGAFSSTKKGSAFIRRRYICCTVVSSRVYRRCHGVQDTMYSVHPLSLHYTNIYTSYTEVSCQWRLLQQVMH